MVGNKLSLLLFVIVLIGSCSVYKPQGTVNGNIQELAIHMAINDFSTRCKLFEKDSVFIVVFADSVYSEPTLERVNDSVFREGRVLQWKRGNIREGIVSVTIGAASFYKQFYSEETKASLPTRFEIRDGKLFIWYDYSYPLTDDIIEVLWRYDVLQTDYVIPDFTIDENEKGAHYYFCKSNIYKFKRIITNIGYGYYEPPRLKCSCSH